MSLPQAPHRTYGSRSTNRPYPDAKRLSDPVKEPPNDDNPDFDAAFMHNDKGQLICNVRNFATYLTRYQALKEGIRYNEFTGQIDITRDLPWGTKAGSIWTDGDLVQLRSQMELLFRRVGRQDLVDAVLVAAKQNAYHPIRHYFDHLPVWDRKERLDRLFVKYAGAKDDSYVRAVTRKSFVACVARVYEPGCKHDEMLILFGGQGIGKSSIFRIMGGQWFCDSLTSFGDKNSMEQLSAAWLIEIPELNSLTKRDSEDVKAFLSKNMDSYRPAYGRYTEFHKRQCVFFGSTNVRECLKDWRNRRFWIIDCEKSRQEVRPNSGLLEEERDQIWAEALFRYHEGETIFLDDRMAAVAERMADDHRARHPWEDTIKDYLSIWIPKNMYESAETLAGRHEAVVKAFSAQPTDTEIKARAQEAMSMQGGGIIKPDFTFPSTLRTWYQTWYLKIEQTCVKQIWTEALGMAEKDLRIQDSKVITQILDELGWVPIGSRRFTFFGSQRAFRKKADS